MFDLITVGFQVHDNYMDSLYAETNFLNNVAQNQLKSELRKFIH